MSANSTQRDDFAVAVRGAHKASKGHGWVGELVWARFCCSHPIRWVRFLWRKEFVACEDWELRKKCARSLVFFRLWLGMVALYLGFVLWVLWLLYFRLAAN
jgi:hypothetical protein